MTDGTFQILGDYYKSMPMHTRLRRYLAQPHAHVIGSPYAVVLSSDYINTENQHDLVILSYLICPPPVTTRILTRVYMDAL